jgi:hypothetical protein
MLATTKQVRALVKGLCSVRTHSYTDKCKSIKTDVSNLRNVTFMLCEDGAKAVAKLELAMFLMGYTNKVKTTISEVHYAARTGGYTYLRINKCVLEK